MLYIRLMSGSNVGEAGDAEAVRQLREVDLAPGRLVDAAEFALRHTVAVERRSMTRCRGQRQRVVRFEKPVVPACMYLPRLNFIAVFWLPKRS